MDVSLKAASVSEAALYNMGAMFAFGFFHSLLARKTVKKWMNLSTAVERSFFCLQAACFLHVIQHFWMEVEGKNIWDFSDAPAACLLSVGTFWFGVIILLSATFALDHFHLFGLTQGWGLDFNKMIGLAPATPSHEEDGGLVTRWHYKYVAHPIMTGLLITLWATPVMTPSRLVCAGFMTTYVLIAVVHFEEPTIREELGTQYDKYLAKTPRFFPTIRAGGASSLVKMD
eukprot:CAMPEP_0194033780 /NCGR_PEP_ID=MMETSP0009_2-20130614/6322_1 /TAXON_ID=210454 /ORGANISM="Grammatophora oceanica, Strain CCMP 410" /LENGTH=228 /DNA_ID=CAMNT_0038674503 /DNA_START=541 /DNA_END=1227 /DNA_ORIENTATION=-